MIRVTLGILGSINCILPFLGLSDLNRGDDLAYLIEYEVFKEPHYIRRTFPALHAPSKEYCVTSALHAPSRRWVVCRCLCRVRVVLIPL